MRLVEPVIYLATDMEAVVSFDFCRGVVCAYTLSSPDKDSLNEDSIALIPCGDTSGVLVVADGLGGMYRGDIASRDVVNNLVDSVTQGSADGHTLRGEILDGLETADEKISAIKNGAASTAAIVEVQGDEVRTYHVGDSVILICGQRGKIKYQSVAHSPVGYAVESGLLAADNAIYHDERHLISNAVGLTPMSVEMGAPMKLDRHDTVLVASDGLFDNLQVAEIVEVIRRGRLRLAAEKLAQICHQRMTVDRASQPHKPDDLSFILFRPWRS